MHYSELKLLLIKYKENRCTSKEIKRLKDYFTDKEKESAIKESLLSNLEYYTPDINKTGEIDFDKVFNSISSKISVQDDSSEFEKRPQTELSRRILGLLKVAAVVVPLLLLGGILSHLLFNETPLKQRITYNEIKAPYGARSEITLPDGSTVWLNAGSKIRYMSVFNSENRDVQLEGEAYFKVAKNKAIPFNVRTGDLNIKAIGTEFNVKSYEEEGIIETTLVEGKISISKNTQKSSDELVYLEPHQKAVYIRDKNKLSVEDTKAKVAVIARPAIPERKTGVIYIAREIDPEPIVAWKENMLILKGEELNSLLVKLERKYDVHFIFESENIKNFRFTGTLGDETLTQVLDFIKLSAPIEYSLEGKTVRIFENKQMMEKFSNHLKKK